MNILGTRYVLSIVCYVTRRETRRTDVRDLTVPGLVKGQYTTTGFTLVHGQHGPHDPHSLTSPAHRAHLTLSKEHCTTDSTIQVLPLYITAYIHTK